VWEIQVAKQVKTKQRVIDHGEVFTAEREVKAMCDMVASECLRIDSRFLEPACGEGNFLAEVLARKLTVVRTKYKQSSYELERNSILAISSIYGIDILSDNVSACRERLYQLWNTWYKGVCKDESNDATRAAVKYILEKNIVCGNALSMKLVDDTQKDTQAYITFPEWTFPLNDARIKRRDFRLDVLLQENTDSALYDGQIELFSDDAMNANNWMLDPVTREIIPKPIREYSPIHYRRITND